MRKTRRTTNLSDSHASEENNEQNDIPEVTQDVPMAQEPEQSVDEPIEQDSPEEPLKALEVWDNIREEFYEQIEQLPLSLQRTFALIGEQDREAQAYHTELLPTIRNYVKLRQAIDTDSRHPELPPSSPSIVRLNDESESLERLSEETSHKTEDIDVPMPDANDNPRSPSNTIPNGRDSTVQTGSASERTPSRSIEAVRPPPSTRSQALREADATVPKSVPFPPKAKPKTSRELLTRISYLTGELLRSSEEKVGLATAANNIVDQHIRALDIAIKELQRPPGLVFHEETPPVENSPEEQVVQVQAQAVAPAEPEPPQDAPQSETTEEKTSPRVRKSRRRDTRRQAEEGVSVQTDASQPPVEQELEVPIDPNEARYCYCNQVSYGEMIACDRSGCLREWFHLPCVGLKAVPKGKWYCKECEEIMQKSKKRRIH
ncbi:hypothetical protein M422DRAFT_34988 [Sphaerobolus stellatus SS14]|uniref:Chromatin modification-related protein n=1 Tax=Sphaerobolus stellatus (strain SS14) TaxID=990650 RepID=A0A0C9UID4_SPHS4|nr:hypothetical protein M422DRAFT_34988 [Sphaerobolus stellatus SS14]